MLAVSSVWQSPPSDGSDQPDYLNAAILIRTAKSPAEIYTNVIAPIEQSLGRMRKADKFAPRTVDIDLAMYDDLVGEFCGRKLPDPDILTQSYVALPLAEISPEELHPETGEPLQVIAGRLRDGAIRRREEILLLPALPAEPRSDKFRPDPSVAFMENTMPKMQTDPSEFDIFRDDLSDRPNLVHEDAVESAVRSILEAIGEDAKREGLRQTPLRVARMFEEMTVGYNVDPVKLVNEAVFTVDYDQMVVVRDIDFASLCEHHLLPFLGKAHVAYIPNGKVIGLSKIPRIVEMYARRLQLQERMTQQIAAFLEETLHPRGVGVVVEALHLCMAIRGVKKANARMITSAVRGSFKENLNTRSEFFAHIDHTHIAE